jgi:parallel beta-helix repeat protein
MLWRARQDTKKIKWMLISMISLMLFPSILAEDPNDIINYPILNYLSWSKGSDIPWTIDFTGGYSDQISLKSSPIECVGSSSLSMNVSGPAIIRFKWKTDASSTMGWLTFRIDDISQFGCPSRDWTEFSYPLSGERIHTLVWTYRKIRSYPIWAGTGWIDDVNVIRMDSLGIGEYVDWAMSKSSTPGDINASLGANWSKRNESNAFDVLTQNLISSDNTFARKPNMTIIIKNIIYTLQAPPSLKGNLIIEPILPKDNEILSADATPEFEFRPISCKLITNCSLIVDDQEEICSRSIIKNESNKLKPKRKLDDEGVHHWKVKCFERGGLCNSTEYVYFFVSKNNSTTLVNQNETDFSRFIYKNITYAINRTKDGGTVYIEKGSYDESIMIKKSITISGKDRPIITVQNAPNQDAISIEEDNVTVSGLDISGGENGIDIGKNEGEIRNITITNNEIANNFKGIKAKNCRNCTFMNNNISNCKESIKDNNAFGIELIYCRNNAIKNNEINNVTKEYKQLKACMHIVSNCISEFKSNTFIGNIFGYSEIGFGINKVGIDTLVIEGNLTSDKNIFLPSCSDNVSDEEIE